MKTVFLTGATGVMGSAGLRELLARRDKFNITLLVRPSRKNRRKMRHIERLDGVRIVWGDLTCYEDVLEGVTGADYVLHVGGMVSPKADYHLEETMATNIGAAENIVRAVKAQPDPDAVRVVYIGSVAQTGDRNPPFHWGRTGDAISISTFDHYAISKTVAERVFASSGLRHWVSLRQSGILYPGILKNIDPIMFHVPLRGVLEWSTVEDSGRLLARLCEVEPGEDFWRRFYNIGSGAEFRLTNYEFECLTMKAAYCPSPKKLFEANWFATKNFHGQWYEDSDLLNDIFHFREDISCEEYFRRMSRSLPFYFRLARLVPAPLMKAVIRHVGNQRPFGLLSWEKEGNSARIAAHIGDLEAFHKTTWENIDLSRPSLVPQRLQHGYDETKPLSEWDIEDMRSVAAFRGGECLSDAMTKGDGDTPLLWRCAKGHTFTASPRLILLGGHWCPDCLPKPEDWA